MQDRTSNVPARDNSDKLCTRCKRILPHEDFLPHKGSRDGLRVWCNFCLIPNYAALKNKYPNAEFSRCSKCKQWKPKSKFAKDSSITRGVSSQCKECRAQWSKANSEYLAQKAREWQRNNRAKAIANLRAWEERNPEKKAAYREATIARFPERHAARQAVRNAVYRGKMPPARDLPCTSCGEPATEYHHWSYEPEKWLEVEAMCPTCHARADRERIEGDRADG